jgi:thioredoxin-like negative regulator of GroEL
LALNNVIDVGSVHADEQKDLKKRFGVRSYPSVYFFNGRNFTKYEGRRSYDEIIEAGFEELRRKVTKNAKVRDGKSIEDEGSCTEKA